MFDERALEVLKRFEASGFEAYLIGGCVRDAYLGRGLNDYDVTTSALPDETKAIFSDCRIIETGIKHGTLTVIYKELPFEITVYRTEHGYSDMRHPDSVTFCGSLEDDVFRRDFTMNAIAWNGEVRDLCGGLDDIRDRTVRCVGDPDTRFKEDALRVLRALRFASVLGFKIDKDTAAAVKRCRDGLLSVSSERIYAEFSKLITGVGASEVIRRFHEVISVFIPELAAMHGFEQHNPHHKYDVLEHTLKVLENVPPVPHMRYAALFHDIGKPQVFSMDEDGTGHFYGHPDVSADIAEKTLKELRADKNTIEKVKTLVKYHSIPIDASKQTVKRRLAKFGEETLRELLVLRRADISGLSDEYSSDMKICEETKRTIDEVISENECFKRSDLAIDGNDLKALGLIGRDIKEALDACLCAVIDGKLKNEKEELTEYVKTRMRKC